ncbi:prepilin peptidase [Candidatus Woesearchaeota archaeon]|nr:prepilin peptidase [Candidatus Woesearchaeota archaeon]
MLAIITTITITALIIATITDIKTREVPDWLNYGLIITGFGIRGLQSINTTSFTPLLEGLAGFGVFFIIAVLMYYGGQWGGGDSKMLMGLGAMLGLQLTPNSFLISLLANMLIAGAFYGLAWSTTLAIKNHKKVYAEIKKIAKTTKAKHSKYWALSITIILLIITLTTPNKALQISTAIMTILSATIHYLWLYVKAVENTCMYTTLPPSKLTIGDWIAKTVKINNKIIVGPKDLGISQQQINTLKKHKIKNVLVKEGIPFVPSFLIAYLLTLFFDNILLRFIELIV